MRTTIRSQNTTISFPDRVPKAIIYGAEGKLDLPDWHGFSGFVSYSYMVGNAWFPVTGGLFLGDDATRRAARLTGHFPDSQDQRNTVRGRVRYQVQPRLWIAGGIQYDTGLPFEFEGDPCGRRSPQYGQQVVNRINFARGRIYPAFQVNASAGADIYKSERLNMRLASRRRKPDQRSECHRLRRPVLRQRHRPVPQFRSAPHHQLLTSLVDFAVL